VIVTGVALKKDLTISGRPYPRDEAAAVGTRDLHKRRHTLQAERASVVAEWAGDDSVVIERQYAAVFAARAVNGQAGGSIHRSLLVQ
jgi:hypothetical protein